MPAVRKGRYAEEALMRRRQRQTAANRLMMAMLLFQLRGTWLLPPPSAMIRAVPAMFVCALLLACYA